MLVVVKSVCCLPMEYLHYLEHGALGKINQLSEKGDKNDCRENQRILEG